MKTGKIVLTMLLITAFLGFSAFAFANANTQADIAFSGNNGIADGETENAEEKASVDSAAKLTYTNGDYTMAYRLYVPADYDAAKSYPVLVFLHGAGERGQDNSAQMNNAIRPLFKKGYDYLKDTIIIIPQCPTGEQWVESSWTPGTYVMRKIAESKSIKAVLSILESVEKDYNTDKNRIYCGGLSMGGFGCWDLLCRHNDIFAAAVIFCGGADTSKAELLVDTPIWTFHGDSDPTVSIKGTRTMVNAIRELGGTKIKYDEIAGGQHGIWDPICTNYDLCGWLFEQKLSDRYPDLVTTSAVTTHTVPVEAPQDPEAPDFYGIQSKGNIIRLVGTVDKLDYKYVGFEYSTEIKGEYTDLGSTGTVYDKVYGGEKEYTPKELDGEYIYTLTVNGESGKLVKGVYIRPYAVTKAGERVYGGIYLYSFD